MSCQGKNKKRVVRVTVNHQTPWSQIPGTGPKKGGLGTTNLKRVYVIGIIGV